MYSLFVLGFQDSSGCNEREASSSDCFSSATNLSNQTLMGGTQRVVSEMQEVGLQENFSKFHGLGIFQALSKEFEVKPKYLIIFKKLNFSSICAGKTVKKTYKNQKSHSGFWIEKIDQIYKVKSNKNEEV